METHRMLVSRVCRVDGVAVMLMVYEAFVVVARGWIVDGEYFHYQLSHVEYVFCGRGVVREIYNDVCDTFDDEALARHIAGWVMELPPCGSIQ